MTIDASSSVGDRSLSHRDKGNDHEYQFSYSALARTRSEGWVPDASLDDFVFGSVDLSGEIISTAAETMLSKSNFDGWLMQGVSQRLECSRR